MERPSTSLETIPAVVEHELRTYLGNNPALKTAATNNGSETSKHDRENISWNGKSITSACNSNLEIKREHEKHEKNLHEPEIVLAQEPNVTSSSSIFAVRKELEDHIAISTFPQSLGRNMGPSTSPALSPVMTLPGAVAVVGPRIHRVTPLLSSEQVVEQQDSPPMIVVEASPADEPFVAEARTVKHQYLCLVIPGTILTFVVMIIAIVVVINRLNPTASAPLNVSIRQILAGISDPRDIEHGGSPQNKSVEWILHDSFTRLVDPVCNQSRIVQRYVLGVLYYSTNGEQWTDQETFLSSGDECSWHPPSLTCLDDNTIAVVQLGKCR